VSPVILLVKLPVPDPSTVLVLNATVAPELVLQQTPRAVTAEPPSPLIVPPDEADDAVIAAIAVVVRLGIVAAAEVVKINSEP